MIQITFIIFLVSSLFGLDNSRANSSDIRTFEFSVDQSFEITDKIFANEETSGSNTYYTIYRFGNMEGYNGKKWFRKWSVKAGSSQEFWNAGWWERDGDKIIVTIYEEFNKREWAPYKFRIEGNNIRQYEEGRTYNPKPLQVDRLFKAYSLNSAPSWAKPAMDRMLNRFPPN